MIHGNGGGGTRFIPFLQRVNELEEKRFRVCLPALPGFDGRPLPGQQPGWEPFIESLQQAITPFEEARWAFYGHGIGGSLLLEWARRGWDMPGGQAIQPERVLLHGIIGASLEHRFFPKMMKPKPVRALMQRLIAWPPLQSTWERRLFQQPERIAPAVRQQFFRDYARCAAFPVFFDLITPQWYREVQQQLQHQDFRFIWGDQERVVASRYLEYWKRDFPNASFDIVPGWDHFPMLEDPAAFHKKILDHLPK